MRIAGIDPDTKAITGVTLFDDGTPPRVWRIQAKGRRAEDRVEGLYRSLDLTLFHAPIDWVYIETPVMGVNAKALRDQAVVVGMIRYWLWSNGQAHSMVDNGTWKKRVLGNGHASKEEIAAYAKKMLNIPADQPQDAYDAACIAAFGRQQTVPMEVSNV